MVAIAFGDLARELCTQRAVVVAYAVAEFPTALVVDGDQRIAQHPLGQLALVKGHVARHAAALRRGAWHIGIAEQRIEVDAGVALALAG